MLSRVLTRTTIRTRHCRQLSTSFQSTHRNGSQEFMASVSAVGVLAGAAVVTSSIDDEPSSFWSPSKNYCHCQAAIQKANTPPLQSRITKEEPFKLKLVYEIDKVLGEGAYGMVYQARRKSDGAIVALKTMPRKMTGKTDFEREVAALQLLSKPPGHSHVVQLYDLHRDDKNYYLAMELIEGGELLDHLLDNGPYSEAVAADFLRQFAEAICFVHSTGLTHADLKLENLMLSSNDVEKAKLKVVDFGCACSHDLSRKDMQLPTQEFAAGCSFLHQAALGNQLKMAKAFQERPGLVNFRDYDRRTALHVAASEGHVNICKFLIEKGAMINRSDRWGGFPLDDAHRHGHTAVVKFLQQHGAKFGSTSRASNLITAASKGNVEEVKAMLDFGHLDLNQGDYDHRTALHLAAGEGHLEVVELLCKAGADVNVEDRWGHCPLDDARNTKTDSDGIMQVLKLYGANGSTTSATVQPASTMHDLKDLASLLARKTTKQKNKHKDSGMTNLPAHEFALGCSILHQAALGNQFELEKILQERPALVNFRDYDRRTALHIAASEGHVDICRYLVAKGARINRSDRWGGSPLDDAHRHKHSDVVKYLQQEGARFGSTSQVTNFVLAASEGDIEEVKAFLDFGDIDLNQGDYDHRTALHLAAGEGQLGVVEMLCAAGADVNVKDRWGNSPMDDAKRAKNNSYSIMSVLEKHGANPTVMSTMVQHEILGKDPVDQRSKPPKQEEENEFVGTVAYCPPELFTKGAVQTPATDMWATGIIMFVLLTGTHPFDKYADKTDNEIKFTLMKLRSKKDGGHNLMEELVFDERIEGLSASCVELLRQLIHPDPAKRMTSEQFLKYPWIQGLTASWETMQRTPDEQKTYWQDRFRREILKMFANQGEKLFDEEMVEMFQALDVGKKSALELEGVAKAFRSLGISEDNIKSMFASADLDGTGVIHWDEFQTLMSKPVGTVAGGPGGLQTKYLQQRFKSRILNRFAGDGSSSCNKVDDATSDSNKLREIFNAIDLEGNGVLDPHEIRVVLRSVGEPDDVISRIFASLDLDRDGGVSWEDFQQIMSMKDRLD